MKDFVLQPYIGAIPITFGMTLSQVEELLGVPDLARRNSLGERNETHGKISVRYSSSDDKLVEMGFLPATKLLYDGHSLFEKRNLVNWLIKHDSEPFEYVGFLIFFSLGITVTGFHDHDDAQKAITVFCKGRMDSFRAKAKPWNPRMGS